MFSYLSAVYGLKQNQQFHSSSHISELLSCRNVIIHRHNAKNNESCGWPGDHFHALFEYYTRIGYQDDRILKHIKIFCNYFTTKDLKPFDYFLLVKKYEMECVFTKTCIPTDLLKHLEIFYSRKNDNKSLITKNNIPKPCRFNWTRNTHDSILDLCKAFCTKNLSVDVYLTPSESADFVHTWCISQNICTREFVDNWIYCLNSKVPHKNTLYFQGVSNSCPKAILDSVIDACEPLAGKVSNGTTGYKFFWKCCLGKRMIALYDPHFDRIHSTDKMLEILEGTESSIPVDDNAYVTMQRTPVIIIGQEYPDDRKIQFEIKNRLIKGYYKLKSFRPPPKKLHPMWLCELAEKYCILCKDENKMLPLEVPKKELTKNDNITQPKIPLTDFATETEFSKTDFSTRERKESENASDYSELSEASSESDFMDTEENTKETKREREACPQYNISPGPSNSNIDKKKQSKGNIKTDKHYRAQQDPITPGLGQGIASPQVPITPGLGKAAANGVSIPVLGQTAANEVFIPGLGKTAANRVSIQGLGQTAANEVSIPGLGKTAENRVSIQGLGQTAANEVSMPGLGQTAANGVSIPDFLGQTAASAFVQHAQQGIASPQVSLTPGLSQIVQGFSNAAAGSSGNESERKRSNEENSSAKKKLRKLWEEGEKKHPEKKVNCTFKNLLRNSEE